MQGIDLDHRTKRKAVRTEPKSKDVYLRLLVKVSIDVCVQSIVYGDVSDIVVPVSGASYKGAV